MTNSTGVNVSVRETSDRIADDRVGLQFNRAPLMRKEIVTKRVLDLFLAGTALVILSPLLALVCLGIKLEGRSPAILRWRRTAFNGREFTICVFTTTALEDECIEHSRGNNSRVTRVGRLLRTTSMDDLPHLFNVLSGQMSLVGPAH